jgi:hypothetical protein
LGTNRLQSDSDLLKYHHRHQYNTPFIVALAIKYFWQRFRHMFKGKPLLRGMEVGLIYGCIAVLTAMWITFSGLSVSITIVATWIIYGTLQGMIAGMIYAKINP